MEWPKDNGPWPFAEVVARYAKHVPWWMHVVLVFRRRSQVVCSYTRRIYKYKHFRGATYYFKRTSWKMTSTRDYHKKFGSKG